MDLNRFNFKSFSLTYLPALLLAILLLGAPALTNAQETEEPKKEFRFADEDLLKFFDANQELSVLQRETNERIAETAQENGLTLERFNQIARAAEIGVLQGGLYSDEEIAAFNTVAPLITGIQRDMQGMLQATLMEKGLSVDYYQEIMNEFRTDQELQGHVRELLRERARQAAREARQREREQEEQNN